MKRETSAYERVMFYYSDKSPMYFAFCLNLEGHLSDDKLKDALVKTGKVYPLSAVRVEKDEQKRQFITTEDVPGYPLTVRDNFSGDWKDEVVSALQGHFDNSTGPMARFVLLRSGNSNHVIAVFHHAVCDGAGALLFLEEMLKFLADPFRKALEPDENNWAPMLHKVISPDNLNKIKKFDPPPFATDKSYTKFEVEEKPYVPFPKLPFELQTVSFTEDETSRLIDVAKKNGVTVHAYAGALILQCFAEEFGEKEGYTRTIQSPINFRPQLVDGADKMFGLFNGLVTAECDCSPGVKTEAIARTIKNTFHSEIASLKPLAGYYNFMTYFLDGITDPELFYENRKEGGTPMNYDFSFSNLGRVGLESKYGEYYLKEIYGPVFSAAKGERVIGAITFADRLFMTLIYDSACFDHPTGKRIWSKIRDRIKAL